MWTFRSWKPAEARKRLSGANATELTRRSCHRRGDCSSPEATSHRRTLPSSSPAARILPSALKATSVALSLATDPWIVRTVSPVAASQRRMVPSKLLEASVLPSGLKHTHPTMFVTFSATTRQLGSWLDLPVATLGPSGSDRLSQSLAFQVIRTRLFFGSITHLPRGCPWLLRMVPPS